jgi:hypothetical protein
MSLDCEVLDVVSQERTFTGTGAHCCVTSVIMSFGTKCLTGRRLGGSSKWQSAWIDGLALGGFVATLRGQAPRGSQAGFGQWVLTRKRMFSVRFDRGTRKNGRLAGEAPESGRYGMIRRRD